MVYDEDTDSWGDGDSSGSWFEGFEAGKEEVAFRLKMALDDVNFISAQDVLDAVWTAVSR
jgi:hypothetical protein